MNIPRFWRTLLFAACGLVTLPPATAATAARVPDTIEQRVAACIACHGREGASTNAGYFPRLAGKPEGYLYNQLLSFRDGRRFNSDMVHMVRHLSDAYLREIAGYFAQLDLPYPPVPTRTDASEQSLQHGKTLALQGDARRGIPACAQCHGEALTGVAPAIPSLLGLPRLYLASQLGDWLNNGRHALPPDCMAQVGRKLNSADINAVASWLAVQPVPANPKPAAALPGPLPMPCSAMGR
ncbi:c-type cytochrome [Variovorax sp. MHTC-1]|uniref:c-type cytochrome n=1 Tax=Variovorax sp. MHTC-1 TaxID=2495593 RepID=UPI000F896515|nr:c-type cytochrome [Variovorax sp. MHTC-1]RST50982.1 c-type cytochrome [Variovorax sp. MHTC-1]